MADTLDDELILDMLRNWNAELPLFQTIIASAPEDAKALRADDDSHER